MFLHTCLAYENLEIKVENTDAHVNLSIRSPKTDNMLSVTLSGPQVAVVASALIEVLTAIGEVEDPLSIFGSAVRIGGAVEQIRREAA